MSGIRNSGWPLVDGALAYAGRACESFELEFVELGGAGRRRGSLLRCWDVPFEGVPPVRSFRWSKGLRHFPGWWWSSTTGDHVGFESWLERDHAMLLDYDRQVVGFSSQPFWLRWPVGQGARRHAPDYFVRRADGSAVVVDVRADDRIEPEDAEAFAAMERACRQVGWGFRRVGVLEPVFCRNLRWLSRYRHPRCSGRGGVADRLVEAFGRPVPLFAGATVVGDTLATLPVVYHLMWHQVLTADLDAAVLGPATVVRAGPGGGR